MRDFDDFDKRANEMHDRAEPLLGPINSRFGQRDDGQKWERHLLITWIIDGCESGPGRREYKVEWSRSIQDQCAAAGVPYFRKQMIVNGKVSHDPAEWDEDLRVRQQPQESAR